MYCILEWATGNYLGCKATANEARAAAQKESIDMHTGTIVISPSGMRIARFDCGNILD